MVRVRIRYAAVSSVAGLLVFLCSLCEFSVSFGCV